METDSKASSVRLKKFNPRATQANMNLHDLSEELPTNWENTLSVA